MIDDTTLDATERIVAETVWCTMATTGRDLEPRTRLVHPVWFLREPTPRGLLTSRSTPLRRRHLGDSDKVSLFYWAPHHNTVAIDARARWMERDELAAAWDEIAAVPEPVGFDPAIVWPDGPSDPACNILELTPIRIVTRPIGQPMLTWRS